ncbi:hypothetical protein GUJ93_ZPchr0226g7145 [Zizania palustris]|uniref:Uncharacterized protein n=1 Tax=Zizania palustris TaxID=103762 RepID=A0A8J5QVV2_ZIZPA|nr:hypothetical protein GUJ93_ZPchr0226g7145 [Zizania palustris]
MEGDAKDLPFPTDTFDRYVFADRCEKENMVLSRLRMSATCESYHGITFLFRFLMGTICDAYYVLVPIYMWIKDQICTKAFRSKRDVLRWLSGNATKNLSILAQYWLLAQPKNLKSGDSGYSENDMVRFRDEEGHWVYDILLHST